MDMNSIQDLTVPPPHVHSEFMEFNTVNNGIGMLRGYIPHTGDKVEWYIRWADCDTPPIICNFALAIRKATP